MFTLRRWSALAAEPGDVEYLDVEDLVALAALLLGEPPPIRDLGLLGSAAARPAASAFGEDAYPDIWLKAAALLQSVLKNHPLVDGNKRLGWLSTAVFLDLNGVDATRASNDDVYDFVMSVPASSYLSKRSRKVYGGSWERPEPPGRTPFRAARRRSLPSSSAASHALRRAMAGPPRRVQPPLPHRRREPHRLRARR